MYRFKMYIDNLLVFLVIFNIFDVKSEEKFQSVENDDANKNAIETNPRDMYSLEMVKGEISDLKELIRKQTTYLRILLIKHSKLEAENSKWLKRYKSTRRYLRKMNQSYKCQDSKKDAYSKIKLQSKDNVGKSFATYKVNNELGLTKEKREQNEVEFDVMSQKVSIKKEAPVVISGADPGFYDFEVDLTSGAYIGNKTGISWVSKLTKGIRDPCGLQGVVKLKFPTMNDGSQETIMIDMWFDNPSEWVFNIGDSAANDGLSGDGSYQENDSEAEGYNQTFTVYGSDKSPNFGKVLYMANNAFRKNLTVLVTNEVLSWKSLEPESGDFMTINDTSLFALKGQSDSQGAINYDIYFSMNRVIAGNYRSGSGLCKVAFKWLQPL